MCTSSQFEILTFWLSASNLSLASSTASFRLVIPLSLNDVLLTDCVLVLLWDLLTFRLASACLLISCSVFSSKILSLSSISSQISGKYLYIFNNSMEEQIILKVIVIVLEYQIERIMESSEVIFYSLKLLKILHHKKDY